MRPLIAAIKSSLLFYLALFAVQVALFFLRPPYHVGSPDQMQIPDFIKWSFFKHFSGIALLYLLWAAMLGVLNGLGFHWSRARLQKTRWGLGPTLAWTAAQFIAIYLFLGFFYPSLFQQWPGLDRLPLGASYLLLASLASLLIAIALRSQSANRWRHLATWAATGAVPFGLLALALKPSQLDLPYARQGNPNANLLLLGFDALDGDTGNAALAHLLKGKNARIFENAFTPLPLTHPAWNSILSGQYPEKHRVRFFFGSPQPPLHPELYLPLRLKKEAGFHTLFASDQPETSFFMEREGFDETLFPTIGWRAHLTAMMMNHFILPAAWLNNAFVEKWFGLMVNTPSLYNYDPARFFNAAFQRLAASPQEKTFLALHTCFLHTPVRLTRDELLSVSDYLSLSPRQFNFWKWPKPGEEKPQTPDGWINPYYLRRELALSFLEDLVTELSRKKYFQNATIVFLSDHGERFSKNYEVYGGIHGVDLETREQNNVMFALAHPQMDRLASDSRWISLIDLAPTLLHFADMPWSGLGYDGWPLLRLSGEPLPLPERPILAESMGFIDDSSEQGKFPQLSIQTLEQSLTYLFDGQIIVGPEYYQRILKKKVFEDLKKEPEMQAPVPRKTVGRK